MERIRLADGTLVENVELCAPNSFAGTGTLDGTLVIVAIEVDIPLMAELTALFGEEEKTRKIVTIDGDGLETTHEGYTRMTGVGYDGVHQTLNIFMSNR